MKDKTLDLTVQPEDDGFHLQDHVTGDFEWWYFDILDQSAGCFLKIVMHIGTDPLRRRVFPQLAISVNTPEHQESITRAYRLSELEADTRQCRVLVRNEVKIWAEPANLPEYGIQIDIREFTCKFRFTAETEGWKPLGKEIQHQSEKKKGAFAWVIPMPKASVEGDFTFKNKIYKIQDGIGYHDHNYIKVDREHPLYVDELVRKWYWGKCYAGRFMAVFMDIHTGVGNMRSLLVTENNSILHSSNDMIDCSVMSYGFDESLGVKYPASLGIQSTDPDFQFRAEFDFDRILDRKDLLEGVNGAIRFLIRKLVAKPAYHGILATVKMKIREFDLDGFGNFESMVFRNS